MRKTMSPNAMKIMLASVLIARSLGPQDYGRYAYVIWLTGIMIMVMNDLAPAYGSLAIPMGAILSGAFW